MSNSKRHLSFAVSTVVGLAAPALAALLLAASTPGLAAATPSAAPAVADPVLHAPTFSTPAPVATRVTTVAPVAVAAPKPVARPRVAHRVARPAVRRTTTTRRTATVTRTTTTTRTTSTTSQPRGADDYPYKSATMDPYYFTARQCVSFAAWRLYQHGHGISNAGNTWGSAYNWDEAARAHGKTVTSTPHVGAIAQWNAHESGAYYAPGSARANGSFAAGGYGHVAWVKQVYSDGSVLVEQYNLGGNEAYSVMRVKAPRYLLL